MAQLTQPKGAVSIETNKEAISRVFGLKKTQISYIEENIVIDNYELLFDSITQTCFINSGGTGTISSWVITGDILSLTTNQGTFTLLRANNILDLFDINYGDSLVKHKKKYTTEKDLNLSQIINMEPFNILRWDSDSSTDDSSRFNKALAEGVPVIYIPNPTVLSSETGKAYLSVKNILITSNVLIIGDAVAGYRQVGGAIRVLDSANYGFYFKGTSNSSRIIGGGMRGISLIGETTANTSIFVKAEHCSSMEFHNVSMRQGGTAFYLQDFMESRIDYCYFNSLGSETLNVIHIGDYMDSSPWNVNNLHISNNTFGSCSGYWIYASDSANADLIWVEGNKFEWDSTPTNANSTNKSVIYAGRVERFYVINNGFVYFYPAHNLYDTILKVGSNAAYGVVFSDNAMWGCTSAYWCQILGGALTAKSNITNASMSYINQSSYAQNIDYDAIYVRTTTGNKPTSYAAKMADVAFISAHNLTGANDVTFVTDSDATFNQTVIQTTPSVEIRRAYVPKDMISSGRVIRVKARCKNTSGSDGQVQLLLNGSPVSNVTSSLVTTQNYLTVPASTSWRDYEWYITAAMMNGAGALIFKDSGTQGFLFDGITLEYAEYIDLNIPWVTGVITANTTVSTVVTMTRLSNYVTGTSSPKADASLGGAISSVYFNGSSNQLIIQLARVASTDANSLATTFKVRVFLQ